MKYTQCKLKIKCSNMWLLAITAASLFLAPFSIFCENPKNHQHLYSVPRIIVLYFWKDWSKRTKVIKWKSIVSTDWQQQTHHLYSHTMFVAWLLKNQDHGNQYVADWRTKDEYFIPQANQDIYCVYCVTFSISSHILQ